MPGKRQVPEVPLIPSSRRRHLIVDLSERMPSENRITTMPLAEIAARCAEETALYRADRDYDPRYCLELFRRAFEDRDQRAWEAVYTRYAPQARRWVRRRNAAAQVEGATGEIVNGAFLRFWRAIDRVGFEFDSLAPLLAYFRLCVGAEVIDRARRRDRDALQRAEELSPSVPDEVEEAERAEAALSAQRCWQALLKRVSSEQERIYALVGLRLGFKPRQIAALYPHIFDGAADVNRIRANFVTRLRRDVELRAICATLLDDPED